MISSAFSRLAGIPVFVILCIYSGIAFGQTSNKGTDFWIAYAGHRDGTNTRLTLFITSEFNATVNISIGTQSLQTVSITANQSQAVTINPNSYNVYIGTNDAIESNKGIHVTSDKPIAVYSHISFSARSSASLVFPTSSLGKDYYAISYTQQTANNQPFYSEFTVIAVEDGTQVEITPTQADINSRHPANQSFIKILNKGDIYQYQSKTDLSGSYINSKDCKPIAVFSGSTFISFCEPGNSNDQSGDNLYQQLLPVTTWGKNFITAPFYNTENGNTDIFRIQIAEDNTTVTVNGSSTTANGVSLNNPYSKGSIITFSGRTPNVIQANKPVSVAQFQTTQACNPANRGSGVAPFPGDPEMTVLNPIEQTLKDITVYSAVSVPGVAPTNITNHYINVILKTADAPTLKVDGLTFPISRFKTIDSEYSYIIIDVTQSSAINPSHRITADGGFVALAYGYGNVESYGYLAGSDLKNLNKFIEVETSAGQAAVQVCSGNSYDLKLILPYITSSIVWNFGNGNSAVTVNNPVYTTVTINGDTFYQYTFTLDPLAVSLAPGNTRFKATVLNPSPLVCNANEDVFLDLVIFPPPEPKFTVNNVCLGTEVSFSNISNLQGFTATNWMWDFGDGSPVSNEASPKHTYAGPGNYSVTLTVATSSGCNSVTSAPVSVQVYQKPVAGFTASNICSGKQLNLTDQSTSSDGNIVSRIWDFGDGTTETLNTAAPVFHIYNTPGNYTISLKVISDLGCESEVFSRVIQVFEVPVVDFSLPAACVSDVVEFQSFSTIADHTEASFIYEWNFGDPASGSANTSNQATGYHKYSSAGTYNVTLKVTSLNGCETALTKVFLVNGSAPMADFTVLNQNSLCSNNEVMIENKSKVNGFGGITKLVWYFDYVNDRSKNIVDNSPSEGKIQKYSYPVHHSLSPKVYKVWLEAYSGTICFNTKSIDVQVKGVPEIRINPVAPLCSNDPALQLQASERYGFTKQTEVFRGDGTSLSGLFNPVVAGPGVHKISCIYTAVNGCTDTAEIDIEVFPAPVVQAGADITILEGQSANISAIVTGNIVRYNWLNAIRLDRTDIPNPVAKPSETTIYTLQVVSDKGCIAEDNLKITVLKDLKIPNVFTPNGDGINDAWEIPYLNGYPGCTVTVFNRLGRKVFSSLGYAEPWDGRANGEDLPSGVYYYIVDPKNGRKMSSGYVTVLK